jgi:hypothetical protein
VGAPQDRILNDFSSRFLAEFHAIIYEGVESLSPTFIDKFPA